MSQPNPVVPTPPPPAQRELSWSDVLIYPLSGAGAMLGAAAGIFASSLAFHSGLYAVIVVGILTGFGAILFARRGNWITGAITGIIALAGGILAEWWILPMRVDDSLPYFLNHLSEVYAFHLLIIALGAACAFYISWRK
ncbi:MAG TPA: hypothetical protein VM008_14630 [Phycisphaerae bacterium]|nr:hypothetical protein [Phycisphaerae bacterium]